MMFYFLSFCLCFDSGRILYKGGVVVGNASILVQVHDRRWDAVNRFEWEYIYTMYTLHC